MRILIARILLWISYRLAAVRQRMEIWILKREKRSSLLRHTAIHLHRSHCIDCRDPLGANEGTICDKCLGGMFTS